MLRSKPRYARGAEVCGEGAATANRILKERSAVVRMESAFAEFVAGEIAEAVVGGVFVGFAERGVVEDLFDEFVNGQAVIEDYHADVDEFGCVFADDADAKKFSVGARKNELEHACGVAGDVAPRVIFVKSAADNVIEFLFLAGFFGFSGGGDFRNGVNAHGKQRGDALFVLQVKGVADGDAALLHGSGSERGETDHVARGVDVRNHGAVVFIHGNITAIVDRETCFFESEAVNGSAAPGGEEGGIRFEYFAAFHCESHATRRVFGFDGALVQQEMHAESGEAVAQAIGNLIVKKWK